ncbi:MAG: hypothetical protein D3907_06985 [Candidatus Electrothrix sp. AUS3]|nr:hypothetical protein [Candidatus Electrothrix gigas]
MGNNEKKSEMLPQIIVAVVIALLVGSSAPWWWKLLFPLDPPPLDPPCNVSISHPANNQLVQDNQELTNASLFAFSVQGTVKNLGNKQLCIYQNVPGGRQWWRAGEPITEDNLGSNGEWVMNYASCGDASSPHAVCLVKAVVQDHCPDSGVQVKNIGAKVCASASYSYRTK